MAAIRRCAAPPGSTSPQWNYAQTGIVCTVASRAAAWRRGPRAFPAGRAVRHAADGADDEAAIAPRSSGPSGASWRRPCWRSTTTPSRPEIERRFGLSLGRLRPVGRRFGLSAAARPMPSAMWITAWRWSAMRPTPSIRSPARASISACATWRRWRRCIVDAQRLGLDIGAGQALERYERWRRFDNLVLIAVDRQPEPAVLQRHRRRCGWSAISASPRSTGSRR